MTPKYSVCICNYNMSDTIERALVSVLEQLDDEYEVVVIDDGSSDDSVAKLKMLAEKYRLLRYISLPRDRKRMLGETRNISIREAKGEYVLLHVDTDDEWEPYIKDFMQVFRRLEACIGRDFLLSGQQLNVARRSFLLSYGPYRNVYHVEDRDLWYRLAADKAYIPMTHRVFRTRLSRPRNITLFKAIKDVWHHIVYDLRQEGGQFSYIIGAFTEVVRPTNNASFNRRVMGAGMVLFAYVASRFEEPLIMPESLKSHHLFVQYREETRGTYADLMRRHGCSPDLGFLRQEAREIFAS